MPTADPACTDTDLIVEAMYQVAADPDRWTQVIDALDDQAPSEDAPADARRGLAHSQEIARLVTARTPPQPTASSQGFGWVALSASAKVVAANLQARNILAEGLGEAVVGGLLNFDNPDNSEALELALRQARARGAQVAMKLERDEESGPLFAYVAPVRTLADVATLSGLPFDTRESGFAVLFPALEDTGRLLSSIGRNFGLTPAELRLAARLRDGKTLKEAADDLDVSINTVRNQLRGIFDKMGLKRQSDLIRALTELAQVAGVVESMDSTRFSPAPPIRLHRLSDGRRLAYREYGVSDGRVVLGFHEGVGSSLLPPPAQALATELGLRVLCVERPGFGQSDPHPSYSFDAVADDVAELCDALGLSDVRLNAVLSGAAPAIKTAIRLGSRARSLLLVSGRPPRPTRRSAALVNRFRARLEDNPWVAESLYSIFRLRLSTSFIGRLIATGADNAPGDKAFAEANPWIVEYVTAYVTESLASTRRGIADEMRAFRRSGNATPDGLNCPVVVWHGDEDRMAPLSDLLEFLGEHATTVEVFPGAGHLLAARRWDEMLRHAAA